MLFFLEGMALVVVFFALSEAESEFGDAARVEIELCRDERQVAGLELTDETIDLCALQEELSSSKSLVIVVGAVGVFSDVHSHHLHLVAGGDSGEGLDDGAFSSAERFHLSALQDNADLHGFEEVVIVAGLAVLGDHSPPIVGFLRFLAHLPH